MVSRRLSVPGGLRVLFAGLPMWQGKLFCNLTWRRCRRLINWRGWHFKWSFKAFIMDLIFPSWPCFSQAQKKSLNQTSPISASKTTDGLRPAPMPGLLSTALPGQEPPLSLPQSVPVFPVDTLCTSIILRLFHSASPVLWSCLPSVSLPPELYTVLHLCHHFILKMRN